MVNVTISLEGSQTRYQTALDKTVGTVTTGTITAGYLTYADTSGGFSVVSTATAAASFIHAAQIWVADFTQSAGNAITTVRGFDRVISDSNGSISVGAQLYPSTVTAGLVSTVQWSTLAPSIGYAVQGGAAGATVQAYIDPYGVS